MINNQLVQFLDVIREPDPQNLSFTADDKDIRFLVLSSNSTLMISLLSRKRCIRAHRLVEEILTDNS